MQEIDNDIDVRTFTSYHEICALEGFREENPVTVKNYKRIVGDYKFEEMLNCCFRKDNGNLCKKEHGYGFVVRLKDQSVSLIGNCCGVNKFDASTFRADRNRFVNEQRRLQRLERARSLLAKKHERLTHLSNIRKEVKEIEKSIESLEGDIGPDNLNRLREMGRTGMSQVGATFVTVKRFTNEFGEPDTEVTRIRNIIGSIKGVGIFQFASYRQFADSISSVCTAYRDLEEIADDIPTKKLNLLVEQLNRYDIAVSEHAALTDAYDRFKQTDPMLFCFLSHNKSDRFRAAKYSMNCDGSLGGKTKAKQWLATKERQLLDLFGADRIEM